VLYTIFLNHGEASPLLILASLYCRERQISFEGQKKQKPSSIPRCLGLRTSSHQKTVIAAVACLPVGRQQQMLVSALLKGTASVF